MSDRSSSHGRNIASILSPMGEGARWQHHRKMCNEKNHLKVAVGRIRRSSLNQKRSRIVNGKKRENHPKSEALTLQNREKWEGRQRKLEKCISLASAFLSSYQCMLVSRFSPKQHVSLDLFGPLFICRRPDPQISTHGNQAFLFRCPSWGTPC